MIEYIRSRKWMESKWFNILLSISLAFLLWMYVQAELDPTDDTWVYNVPVEITGSSVLNRQGLTISGLSVEEVDIHVEAPTSDINDLLRNRKDISVVVDVSKCTEGENKLTFDVVYPNNVNGDSIVTTNRRPESITVTVEKLYAETFDIKFQLVGEVAQGYSAGTPAINPETVLISGPEEQVNLIGEVVAVLETGDLRERFAGDLPLTLLDAKGDPLSDLDVTMDTTTAYVVLPVVVVKEIPLTVHISPGGGATKSDAKYSISPKTITVSGAEEDLRGLEEISLGSIDLAKVVGTNEFQKEIVLDPSLENVSGLNHATVTVSVEGLSTRSFDVENIRLSNVPDGYTAVSTTQMRTVVVRGREEALANLDASQLRIVADLSDISAVGSYPVPVRVYLDAVNSVGVIGEYSILVNISK